jgi:hypothetical protein
MWTRRVHGEPFDRLITAMAIDPIYPGSSRPRRRGTGDHIVSMPVVGHFSDVEEWSACLPQNDSIWRFATVADGAEGCPQGRCCIPDRRAE